MVYGLVVYEFPEKYLLHEHFLDSSNDITLALQKIDEKIQSAAEKYVRIFFITDGALSRPFGQISPYEQLDQMHIPHGKKVSTYVLAVGVRFPVKLSVHIRANLHNGSPNTPTLFWAKNSEDIAGE